jgi:hypothetical protein
VKRGGLTPGSSIRTILGGLTPGSSTSVKRGGLTPGSSDTANAALDTAQQTAKAIKLTFILIAPCYVLMCELTQTAENRPPAN